MGSLDFDNSEYRNRNVCNNAKTERKEVESSSSWYNLGKTVILIIFFMINFG